MGYVGVLRSKIWRGLETPWRKPLTRKRMAQKGAKSSSDNLEEACVFQAFSLVFRVQRAGNNNNH
jgi:hypothetical protein